MKNIKWLVNRVLSMNASEIIWRIQQNILQRREYKMFFVKNKPVTEIAVSNELKVLKADGSRIGINWNNKEWSLFESLDLFGIFDYQKYKNRWNAGFQTENMWPTSVFSYDIPIKQREDIGDIRTNWELNRHYQFSGLAKNYYLTNDERYLNELILLFNDWNKNNLFLHGVEWTSAMEVAIRLVSWSYTYAFIEKTNEQQNILDKISNGIKVMANYIMAHRARCSSANNHLIVEMLGVGMAGILFSYERWIDYSVKILTEELAKQNYSDGVNKEMSLHYQAFIMEAYGIMAILLRRNNKSIPESWITYLTHMSEFVADCCGDYGETIVFGDNDEGKIIDFTGKVKNYYQYILQLMGIVLSKKYITTQIIEDIRWIATPDEIEAYKNSEGYVPGLISNYREGGYTILRSKDRKVLIGFDHANLGFGKLAAHGHADALSVQVFYKGLPMLVDSGTYNYHVPRNCRDSFREEAAHNTVKIKNKCQAKILGPFLWGKRYSLLESSIENDKRNVVVKASISYEDITHTRILEYDFDRNISVMDKLGSDIEFNQIWNVVSLLKYNSGVNTIEYRNCSLTTTGKTEIRKMTYSETYNQLSQGERLIITNDGKMIKTNIQIKE